MSAEEPDHKNSPTLSPVFLTNTTATNLTASSPLPPGEIPQPLSIIIALACIFLLLATFLLFVTLCKPAAMDPTRHSPHECMPYHPETSSEPQLRFWKRLGSLRQSIHSFRRGRPGSQHPGPAIHQPLPDRDWGLMESTKM
ncbi:uncharacterized protein C10orf105 homolog [Trichosurus vulpecula]|uniref:uncharacterized protein C10orf105 homolog n=1 Tax=Trichosurus vulpecula TaxID=9337 RepID=UPI00186B364A|nr:uncharacterized protein C10orf105 homolog [Trichosurus vulpecula]